MVPMYEPMLVFLNGIWQVSQEEVPMHRWPSKSCTAPETDRRGRGVAATTTTCTCRNPPLFGHRRQDLARYRSHGNQVGHFLPIDTAPGQQAGIVIDMVQVAVIGQQVRKDRGLRRRHPPGQAHAQVIGRLEQLVRLPINLRAAVLDKQDMRQGIIAGMHRYAAGQTQPAPNLRAP